MSNPDSNPDPVFVPARGETELDLLDSYLAVSGGPLRGVFDGPTVLERSPDGALGDAKRVAPESGPKGHVMRPSRWQVVTLVVALCFLTGVVGWWIGRPTDPSFNDVDVGFLSDMETHHGGAISLAFAYIGAEHDPLVGQIAREIVLEQSQEISVMNVYLGQAGPRKATTDDVAMDWMGLAVPISRMPGMPTNAEMAELRAVAGRARRTRSSPGS